MIHIANNEMPRQRNGKRAKTLVDSMRSNALDLAISELVRGYKSNGGRAPNGLYETTVSGLADIGLVVGIEAF